MEAVRKQRPEPNRRVGRAGPFPPGAPRRKGSLALRILGWSAVGALVAMALTAVGLALVFWHYSHGLPSIKQLADYHPKQVTVIEDKDGDRIGEIYTERRTYVSFDEVPKMMSDAFVVAEDANFYTHGGIDYRGMIRAAFTNLRSGRTRHGASTITQQVVKNFVLSPERTFKRKIQEIILARRLESELTKKEILTLYMNQIYFGAGRYGVQEAARFYFGKDVKDLNVGEMALLAGLPQAPEEIAPYKPKNYPRAKERQTYVLNQLARHGKITAAEAQKWIDQPIQVVARPYPMLDTAPEWVEEVRSDLLSQYGPELDTAGLEVKTTLRPDVQLAARKALDDALRAYDARHKLGRPVRQVKADKIDLELAKLAKHLPKGGPKAGDVYEAIVTGVFDADNELEVDLGNHKAAIVLGGADDERWNPPVDGRRKKPSERFARGDVVKVAAAPAPADGDKPVAARHGKERVVLAPGPEGALVVLDPHTRDVWAMVGGFAARAAGFDRATMAHRQPGSGFKPIVYAAALGTGRFTPATIVNDSPEVYDLWKPHNYESGTFSGPVRLRFALAKSINTVAIKVLHDIGPDAAADLAKQLGIAEELPRTLSLALGSGEVTPLELTNAFASFADGGVYAAPRFVASVDGKPAPPVQGTQVVTPEVAYVITDMMRSVVEQGTAAKARSLGITIAGKTGTSNDVRDCWFVGMTPDVVIGVWVGNDDSTPLGSGEVGGVTALPAFIEVAKSLGLKDKPFPRPPNVDVATIDLATGLLAAPGSPPNTVASEVFVKGTAPTEVAAKPGEIDARTFVTDEYGDEAESAPAPAGASP
ncbi:MAG TPA: PBP1A family penicillin-binding protein [Kofleriaceae bacterium]|nr:PBP1A family penicillin-binding protein [Kofleriaceae bacterium]